MISSHGARGIELSDPELLDGIRGQIGADPASSFNMDAALFFEREIQGARALRPIPATNGNGRMNLDCMSSGRQGVLTKRTASAVTYTSKTARRCRGRPFGAEGLNGGGGQVGYRQRAVPDLPRRCAGQFEDLPRAYILRVGWQGNGSQAPAIHAQAVTPEVAIAVGEAERLARGRPIAQATRRAAEEEFQFRVMPTAGILDQAQGAVGQIRMEDGSRDRRACRPRAGARRNPF